MADPNVTIASNSGPPIASIAPGPEMRHQVAARRGRLLSDDDAGCRT
jgi:hypothetical protein